MFSITFQEEHRVKEHQRHHGEHQPCDGAHGEGEPEDFAWAVEEEGDEAQDRGKDGQGDGADLVGEGTEVGTAGKPFRHQVDPRVDRDAAEHHEGREAALVEGEVTQAEGQEQAHERQRNHQDDGQRKAQGVEMDGQYHGDDRDHQQDQPGELLLAVVIPAASLVTRTETDRQHAPVHPVHGLLNHPVRELIGTDEVKAHRDRVRLVLLPDGHARAVLRDAPHPGELHLMVRIHGHGRIIDVPEVQRILFRRHEPHVHIASVIRKAGQHGVVQRRLQG